MALQIRVSNADLPKGFQNTLNRGNLAPTGGNSEFPIGISNSGRPVIRFKTRKSHCDGSVPAGTEIVLPAPPNLSFQDTASYSDTPTGLLGGLIRESMKLGDTTSVFGELNKMITNGRGIDTKAGAVEALGQIAGKVGRGVAGVSDVGAGAVSAYMIASGAGAQNKNVVSEFTQVNTRSFAFAFKMVAFSKDESAVVKKIHDTFRMCVYPYKKPDQFRLQFPPTWTIQLEGATNIPGIFECYLENCNTVFNAGTNNFYEDGSPTEVDLQISFKETRALTCEDIAGLSEGDPATENFTDDIRGGTDEALTSVGNIVEGGVDALRDAASNLFN